MVFDLHSYDKYIICFSGGKDSIACFLYLILNGVDVSKIELWHHDIDGRDGAFMDWEITPDYCRKFAAAFGVPIYFQWKDGGFEREMLRDDAPTAPVMFELPDGTIGQSGGKSKNRSTRLKFPQESADLNVRWCSAYLKIDVCKTAICNQDRFKGVRVLVLSGERGEESPQRAKYEILERDKSDLRDGKKYTRYVDRYRPIRDWKENQVWEIIERYRVRVHPCYYLGWGRCSCKFCIFGNKNQMASAVLISPEQAEKIFGYEERFGYTMKRAGNLRDYASEGKPYEAITKKLADLATGSVYDEQIIIPASEVWELPAGAYGDSCGAT